MNAQHYVLSLIIILLFSACRHQTDMESKPPEFVETLEFLFLGHPRMGGQGLVNPQLSLRDWKAEGVLLLGGDLDLETSRNASTLMSYDQIFDFASPTTFFALGNHDYTNLDFVLDFTQKENFYYRQLNKTVVFVADTQLDKGSIEKDQFQAFEEAVNAALPDPVSGREGIQTFILLTHKLIWMPGNPELEEKISEVANGPFGGCDFCTGPNNFYTDIYPRLMEMQEEGIQVICLAGDLGQKRKFYQHKTEGGIFYIGNGWQEASSNNNYLEFYQAEGDSLRWDVIDVE